MIIPYHIRTLPVCEFQDKTLALSFYPVELLFCSNFPVFPISMSKFPALQKEEVTPWGHSQSCLWRTGPHRQRIVYKRGH